MSRTIIIYKQVCGGCGVCGVRVMMRWPLARSLCSWNVADEREKNEKLRVKNVKKGLISCQFPIILLTLRGKVGMCAYGF